MSLAALAQEKFWENKAQCEDAEKAYYSRLSGAKEPEKKAGSEELDLFADSDEEAPVKPAKPAKKKAPKQDQGSSPNSSLAAEIAKARQHIKNSLECVDKIEANAGGAGASADVLKKLKDLELENKDLKKVTSDLKAMIVKLEGRVAAIEKAKPAAAAAAPAKAAPAPAADDEDDDDVDLFGSESEEEESEEAAKVREERLAAYAAKKSKKPALIAKTSVLLDCKPWDDETDMDVMLKEIKKIEMDGLVWGANKLVPVGYGISKLQVMIVVEDLKVSIEELQEKICEIEDYVQSCDVAAMNKI